MIATIAIDLKSNKKANKITVAEQQLEAAVILLFKGYEYAPIHTLTGAATQILEDLCRSKGIVSESHRLLARYISNDTLDPEIARAIRKPRNFFKHADNDSESLLELPSHELTNILIYQGIADYESLGFEKTEVMRSFNIWYIMQHPESLDKRIDHLHYVADVMKTFSEEAIRQLGLCLLLINTNHHKKARDVASALERSTGIDIENFLRTLFD